MVEASKVVKYPYTDQSLFEFWKNDNQDEPSIRNFRMDYTKRSI